MPRELPAGTVINDYRIERLLSNDGNFAIVYLACDTNAERVETRRQRIAGRLTRWRDRYGDYATRTHIDPGPMVALKEYCPLSYGVRRNKNVAAASGQGEVFAWGRERFQRESEFLAEHSHPNVVAVFDHFKANNTEYYVMEQLTGGSLKTIVERSGPQNEATVQKWLLRILDALGSVERRNANHLDISPGNILFRSDGEAVLVDFGAARISGSSPVHKSRLVVTDPYSPPEKYKHTSSSLDASSDIYALGATVFYALTGREPTASNQRTSEGPPFPAAESAQLRKTVSGRLLRTLEQACALDRSKRFDSSEAFSRAVGVPQEVTPRTDPARKDDPRTAVIDNKRTQLLILGAAAIGILLIVGCILIFW